MTDAAHRDHPAYGSLTQPRLTGGVVSELEPGSPAEVAGVQVGDRILTADGLVLRDVIDWQWIADDTEVEILSERGNRRTITTLEREPGHGWGLAFERVVFDRIHICANDCAFCFMSQLPRGLRPSLYLRDDDYRLSFLSGTFITLTNLTDSEITRIEEQRLSPLYVSLHAVAPQVRAALVCARGEDLALDRFDALIAAGIDLHVQIVLVPGVNDAGELDHTLSWLAERGEHVASVGVVPLGYTGHQERFDHSFQRPEDAAHVIAQLEPWQQRSRELHGVTWVQAADELYLAAGVAVPAAESYDDYPQYENGIGMVRAYLDEWDEARAEAAHGGQSPVATLVTGELFAPVLRERVATLGRTGSRLRVLAVPNRFLGGNVSVAGLLTAEDLVAEMTRDLTAGRDGPYLVPDIVLNDDGLTLDDVPGACLGERAGAEVRMVDSTAAGLLRALGLDTTT